MTIKGIRRYFHLDEVDHRELLITLLSHFGHAAATDADSYIFEPTDKAFSLTVRLDAANKVKEVTPSPGFPDAELDSIESRIVDTFLKNQTTAVGQEICFTYAPVTGTFRYRDKFQLIPVPPNAPRPEVVVADNPFILQFAYPECTDWSINGYRRFRLATAYAQLLNFLANRRIFRASRSLPHTWVVETAESQFTSRWRQRGYAYPDFNGRIEAFSDPAPWPPMTRVPAQAYHGSLRVITGEPLQLPDNAEATLDRVFALAEVARNQFDRALAWVYHADAIWPESHSAAFVALVTAIESLIGTQERCQFCNQAVSVASIETCPECRQPRYRVTKTFRDFLDRFVPVAQEFAEARNLLYRVRSALVHGLTMLAADVDQMAIMSVDVEKQRFQQALLSQVTRIAIYNWLYSR